MLRILFAVAATLAAGSAVASAPRISFERIIPARHGLRGAEEVALVYAIGDNESVRTFLDVFLSATNRSGLLRVHDATAARGPATAGVHLRVSSFTCRTAERTGEGNAYDHDGKRIRRRHRYIDATCTARIDLQDAGARKPFDSFQTRGEGTSPRVDRVSSDEIEIARDQAARYAALAAAEQITPRRVRETIVLMDEAPEFAGAIAMIDSGRLDAARRMWEGAARRNSQSAPLRHNLAAVCEALGDIPGAASYYEEAHRLAPAEAKHRIELEMFRRRNGIASKKR